ncbi:MAG: hypothetical protein ABWY78_01615 [Microvirga sp.]
MTAGAILMVIGALVVAVFVHLSLNVQPRLFPGEVEGRDGLAKPSRTPPRSHLMFGLSLAAILFLGVALFSLGSAIIATTLGYGHG